jgi:hypothetical protein
MDPYCGATRPYYTNCKNCALCYDKNYNIKNIRNIRIYKNLYLKYSGGNVTNIGFYNTNKELDIARGK